MTLRSTFAAGDRLSERNAMFPRCYYERGPSRLFIVTPAEVLKKLVCCEKRFSQQVHRQMKSGVPWKMIRLHFNGLDRRSIVEGQCSKRNVSPLSSRDMSFVCIQVLQSVGRNKLADDTASFRLRSPTLVVGKMSFWYSCV